ncbi:N-acetylmuramoyl-L-alanine amidase [Mucilaginibacter terrenus]|uniref:N-acetylmuramoyl-L-alanine amidase n=1 Tax=Mucilaginibacter terrenus TaxID=2482727 RepID=A0A3E2NPT2_9SPHI|nr:N-acetylmuramoyl-L-alanine amidase [Mucilaginibacter terrenus]RFZ83002.1 N-acetylmuramoyl-L-alanine amidase [Mucilaginibacter terrenus]
MPTFTFRIVPVKYCVLIIAAAAVALSGCSHKGPYALTNEVHHKQTDSLVAVLQQELPAALLDSAGKPIASEWVGTVNFNLRKPNYVIIHYTAQDSLAQTLRTFTLVKPQVSAHYVVAKDGKVVHMLNDYLRAWHAGVSKWGTISDMNSCSIGIELDNNGKEPFAAAQMKSLLALLTQLKKAYNIPTANFIGHGDIAPLRKPDPGALFPWAVLAQKGFGIWPGINIQPAPENFDTTTALRLIGYDTSNLPAAIVAFKRHFIQTDISPQLTPCDLDVLFNLSGMTAVTPVQTTPVVAPAVVAPAQVVPAVP